MKKSDMFNLKIKDLLEFLMVFINKDHFVTIEQALELAGQRYNQRFSRMLFYGRADELKMLQQGLACQHSLLAFNEKNLFELLYNFLICGTHNINSLNVLFLTEICARMCDEPLSDHESAVIAMKLVDGYQQLLDLFEQKVKKLQLIDPLPVRSSSQDAEIITQQACELMHEADQTSPARSSATINSDDQSCSDSEPFWPRILTQEQTNAPDPSEPSVPAVLLPPGFGTNMPFVLFGSFAQRSRSSEGAPPPPVHFGYSRYMPDC